jgi:hypothetical protein
VPRKTEQRDKKCNKHDIKMLNCPTKDFNFENVANSCIKESLETPKEINRSCSNFDARASKLENTESDNELKQ